MFVLKDFVDNLSISFLNKAANNVLQSECSEVMCHSLYLSSLSCVNNNSFFGSRDIYSDVLIPTF